MRFFSMCVKNQIPVMTTSFKKVLQGDDTFRLHLKMAALKLSNTSDN